MDSETIAVLTLIGITLLAVGIFVLLVAGIRASHRRNKNDIRSWWNKFYYSHAFYKKALIANRQGTLSDEQRDLIKRRYRKKADLMLQQEIQSGEGIYYFDFTQKYYILRMGDAALPVLIPFYWVPGVYKIYCLSGGIFLSAEPDESGGKTKTIKDMTSISATLSKALAFSEADLEKNRQKKISDGQQQQLKTKAIIRVGIIALLILVGAVLSIAYSYDLSVLPIFLALLICAFLAPTAIKQWRDFLKGEIATVMGCGWPEPYGKQSTSDGITELGANLLGFGGLIQVLKILVGLEKHEYHIGDQAFVVSELAWAVLNQGLVYKAFYLPRTKKLLSVEFIKPWDVFEAEVKPPAKKK